MLCDTGQLSAPSVPKPESSGMYLVLESSYLHLFPAEDLPAVGTQAGAMSPGLNVMQDVKPSPCPIERALGT